jgi:hypothetical protein
MTERGRTRLAALLFGVLVLGGCGGGGDFKNEPRPAVPIQLTGVITNKEVTVSPNKLGAGPIVLLISNETNQAHTVTLIGPKVNTKIESVNPQDVGKIQATLLPGQYTVSAGSSHAVKRPIKDARLSIGAPRPNSSSKVLLP